MAYPHEQVEADELSPEELTERVSAGAVDDHRIFVTLPEEALSCRPCPTSSERVPCEALALAEATIRAGESTAVILVCDARVTLTALDVASAMIMGAVAIVDCEHLVSQQVLAALLRQEAYADEFRTMQVIGKPFASVLHMKELLSGGFALDPKVDFNGWRACVALAQLDRLEPVIGVSQPLSYQRLADALNLEASTTGFKMTNSDLRKALSAVSRRFYGEQHHAALRTMLPLRVREEGFPRDPPALTSIPGIELPGRLYKLLSRVKVLHEGGKGSVPRGILRIHQSSFDHLSRMP